jgi:hypothetical protein
MAALHGLCGQSHAVAVHAAAAAQGRTLPPAATGRWVIRLAGERLGEHLRSLFLAEGANPDPAVLRAAIGIGQRMARSGTVAPEDAVQLEAVLAALGVSAAEVSEAASPPQPVDALTRADDSAVIAALAADTGFIRAPHLPGRAPETGPAARRSVSAADPAAARAARLAEIRDAAARLLDTGSSADWISADGAGSHTGYAAVESPRGRLYYRLVLNQDQQLADARVLAPTEWNFHPDGPLARALIGARPGPDPAAAITRRAAAFDPCVALRVVIENADA